MSDKKKEFKDPSRLIVWIKYLLFVQVFMALIAIGSNLMEYQLLTDFQNGVYFSQEMAVADAETNDQRQQIIAISYMALFIVSGFLILKWIYQANQNVRFLGAKNMEFTPGWSIGFYFIPILALWKPYQAMKEIWKASHNPQNWQLEKANLVFRNLVVFLDCEQHGWAGCVSHVAKGRRNFRNYECELNFTGFGNTLHTTGFCNDLFN